MIILQKGLILLVALEHVYICFIEMFAWEKKGAAIVPGITSKFLTESKKMAANQGLYNAFLAAGLIWALMIRNPGWAFSVSLFFLICVVTAGIYGAVTSSRSIFWKQALPALIALVVLCLTKSV